MSISIEIIAQCNECREEVEIASYDYKNSNDCLIVSVTNCEQCRIDIQQTAIDEYKHSQELNKNGE